ncbi:DUF2397 family protein [Streptomyces sp. NPDC001922]|uniref:DUF2397 family protein n=1 Tax=unclassified Streptomyces TaxID=2593676 RepID=UPI0035DD9938
MAEDWWSVVETGLFDVFTDDRQAGKQRLTGAVLAALLVASSRGPMWTLSDIRKLLVEVGYENAAGNEDLVEVLEVLKAHGYVTPSVDHTAAVESLSDGRRRREAWALTRQGRVVVAGIRDIARRLHRSLRLPPRLLDAVEQTLQVLLQQYHEDAEMLDPTLDQVRAHLEQLQEAGGDFYSAVGSLAQGDVTDDAVFITSRRHILLALQHFARRTEQSLHQVRAAFGALAEVGTKNVVHRAIAGAGILDPAERQAWTADRERDLADLEAWFVPHGSIERLVNAAADAIHALLGAIDRRFYASARGSDVGEDFRQIARMLHAQPTEARTQQVFAAAFGIWPARHPVETVEESLAPLHTTRSAGSRTIKLVLRPHDRGARSTGAPRKVADLTEQRRAAEAANEAEIARTESIARALATPGVVPLTHFTGLDTAHAEVLVDLIEEALNSFDDTTGTGTAATVGAELTLWIGTPGHAVSVVLQEGELIAPDFLIRIRCTPPREGEEAA